MSAAWTQIPLAAEHLSATHISGILYLFSVCITAPLAAHVSPKPSRVMARGAGGRFGPFRPGQKQERVTVREGRWLSLFGEGHRTRRARETENWGKSVKHA
jgi:hypothetical protein